MTLLRMAPLCLTLLLLSPSICCTEAFVVPKQRTSVYHTIQPSTTTTTSKRSKNSNNQNQNQNVAAFTFGWANSATTRIMSRLDEASDRPSRKRDLFRRDMNILSKVGFSGSNVYRSKHLVRPLFNKKSNGDDMEKEKKEESSTFAWAEDIQKKVDEVFEPLLQKILDLVPPPILVVLKKIWIKITDVFPTLRLAFLSFAAGAILTVMAILVPVYSSVESLSEPVTLFETILADLDAGYVDPVDTNKLFETGVAAMLRSLDPYTEFETRDDAQQLNEGIMGRYGGVGLVIAGTSPKDIAQLEKMAPPTPAPVVPQGQQQQQGSKILPKDAIDDNARLQDGDMSSNSVTTSDDEDDDDDFILSRKEQFKAYEKAKQKGIRVISAFEGYAFDYGMRTGDKLVAVDDLAISPSTTVEDVRNVLRGEPGTMVTINFEREGVNGIQEVIMPRRVVQLRDVKLATLLGKPSDGIGYVSLSGFAANAGSEVRQAILALEQAAEEASDGAHSLQGLVLDLRGNPGGLLTSAVDVASLLVPKGSDIVSAKGRGFPGVTYRSRVDPVLEPSTKLAVLVNRGTASAAEIVSGAVQDLDVGVIIGGDRTFGKGLVQNVEDLPFNTALKFTVAKYYTPSGRCIQGVNYKEGGGRGGGDGGFQSSKVAEKDRQTFYTKSGRIVKDGGGVEADFKVAAPKASALEITLLRSDVLGEFAAQWSRKNQITHNFDVDDNTYREFQEFVEAKRKTGDLKLDNLYAGALRDLKRALKESGYKGSEREVGQLQASIVRDLKNDYDKYKEDIKEDIAINILSRYIPESMIMQRGLKTDKQVLAAAQLLGNTNTFDTVLAKGSNDEIIDSVGTLNMASSGLEDKPTEGASLQVEW